MHCALFECNRPKRTEATERQLKQTRYYLERPLKTNSEYESIHQKHLTDKHKVITTMVIRPLDDRPHTMCSISGHPFAAPRFG